MGHIVRRGRVEKTALDPRRDPGVRLRDQREFHRLSHPFERAQRALGAHPAVGTHRIRAGLGERPGGLVGRHAEERRPLLGEGQEHDDGDLGSGLPRGPERQERLGEAGEGLDQQAVHPAREEGRDLFRKRGADRCRPFFIEGADDFAARADGSEHQPAAAGRAPRHRRARGVDRRHFGCEAVTGELAAVRAEGVGGDEFGARRQVRGVDAPHPVRVRAVQIFERAPRRDAPGIERGADRAVAHPGTLPQEGGEFGAAHEPADSRDRAPSRVDGIGGDC